MQLSGILCTFCSVFIIHFVSEVTSQTVNEYDGYMAASFRESSSTFFALQSCHQILHGDSGEFFSPDYLCSHPPLWCNWTVQVRRGMRVRLYLEDLTPESACRRKTDQVHLDEAPGSGGGSRILERCWRSAEYTATSNVVHVVQLISPNPEPPHRGFYGAYQAFGDPDPLGAQLVDHVPQDDDESEPEEFDTLPGQQSSSSESPPLTEGPHHAHQRSALPTEAWSENSAEVRKTRAKSGNRESSLSPTQRVDAESTLELEPPLRLAPSTRAPNDPITATMKSSRMSQAGSEKHYGNSPGSSTKASRRRKLSNRTKDKGAPVLNRKPLDSNLVVPTHPARPTSPPTSTKLEPGPVWTSTVTAEVWFTPADPATLRATPTSGAGSTQASQAGVEEHDGSHPGNGTNAAERREQEKIRNTRRPPEPLHRPGVVLEVTVEVRPTGGEDHDWSNVKHLYTAAVETMISKSAENLDLKSISSKRSKRLSEGALFIVWVQFAEVPDDRSAYRVLQSNLLQLQGQRLDPPGHLVVLSISIEDIDACQSGSLCPCLHGYSPGLAGATCAIPQSDDCGSRAWLLLSVLCFLLCLLIALILATMLLLYRRYHRGSFSTTDMNNNQERSERSCSGPTPPAPPLHLLRFSPLTPPKGSEGKSPPENERI